MPHPKSTTTTSGDDVVSGRQKRACAFAATRIARNDSTCNRLRRPRSLPPFVLLPAGSTEGAQASQSTAPRAFARSRSRQRLYSEPQPPRHRASSHHSRAFVVVVDDDDAGRSSASSASSVSSASSARSSIARDSDPSHSGCDRKRFCSASSSAASSLAFLRRFWRRLCARRSRRARSASDASPASAAALFGSARRGAPRTSARTPALERNARDSNTTPSSASAAARPVSGVSNSSTANPRLRLPSSRFFRGFSVPSSSRLSRHPGTAMDRTRSRRASPRRSRTAASTVSSSVKKSKLPTYTNRRSSSSAAPVSASETDAVASTSAAADLATVRGRARARRHVDAAPPPRPNRAQTRAALGAVAPNAATADMPPQERGANWIKRSDEVRRNALIWRWK